MKKPRKIRVGIIFGGKSTEHEVSLQSAKNVIAALDKEKYEPVMIGIDKTGRWFRSSRANYLLHSENPKLIALNKKVAQGMVLIPGEERQLMVLSGGEVNQALDVVFPILHGPLGEDGTMQGLLKLIDIPFVGPGVLGSAIGMDKDVQKRILRDAGIPIAKFLTIREQDKDTVSFTRVKKQLGLPLFIKPANAGSSVGVTKVKKEADFQTAIEDAFRYDSKILIEEGIDGREIECAILGNEDPIASVLGEIKPNHEFYSYEAKYIDENGAVSEIPAKLPKVVIKKVQETAVASFKALECEGMARVDSFLTKDGRVLVNEINTIPGFTKISMYPKLWEASGIAYPKLIDTLITLALARAKREKRITTNLQA
ncbi:MAG TPA: D-alanine--D-alanine ligase [Candidatus Taylorbacteria bacterium]|nr:MAG: D-alanine-D-alanine ligase [Parcubacteria group bacterium GW2011_GWA2_47_64]KKU96603.1 MAG: D-alanine-D-alanine ligase [Parcubacteria group bacterium GW2011_GWC2_48_17]HBV01280.1 D-alanine--D-alanine ligase [Candidatus Taylorbacteria bacterium]